MRETVEVTFRQGGDIVWIRDKQFMSLKRYNERLTESINDLNGLIEKIEELHKENKALRVLLGLPEEGPLGINVKETETFFDDSEEEAADEAKDEEAEEEAADEAKDEEAKDEDVCEWERSIAAMNDFHTTCDIRVEGKFLIGNVKRCPFCEKKIKIKNTAVTKEE